MADRIVKVSDLSGDFIESEEELGRLVVEGYPEFGDTAITLDVKPSEVEGEIPENGDLVVLSYIPPGESARHRFFMERSEFDRLAGGPEQMQDALDQAFKSQAQAIQPRRGHRRQQTTPSEKIDYADPLHAGLPHRGRATEAEQEYVRAHLPEVNERLSAAGVRQIDPTDPKMARRYGFAASEAA